MTVQTPWYGDGADGALNFDGTSNVLGISPTGTTPKTYTLTRDIFAASIHIAANVSVDAASWRVFCKGACVGANAATSIIHNDGVDAPAATIGVGIANASSKPAGFFDIAAPGNNGPLGNVINNPPFPFAVTAAGTAAGIGNSSTATSGSVGSNPMQGGGGGGAGGPAAGSPGGGVAGGSTTALSASASYSGHEQLVGRASDTGTRFRYASGGGQGTAVAGGVGAGTNPVGGGGGGGGGCVLVAAQSISTLTIRSRGGNGATGAALASTIGTSAAASGGGGGGGGIVIVLYGAIANDVTTIAPGGNGGGHEQRGTGCVAGDGGAGANGWVFLYGEGTVDASGTPGSPWFGPWFPDFGGDSFWFGPWFPDGKPNPAVVQPNGPGGAATFLLLESGSKMTLSWGEESLNHKFWSGGERRVALLDDPKRTFVGAATLVGDETRAFRAALARYIAIGSTFLLVQPFEAITIRADSSGAVVPTTSTDLSDWMIIGQRVALVAGDKQVINATIQSFTSNSVTLDIDPGELGRAGGQIMPTLPVFFDPQMASTRFRGDKAVEQLQLNARAAVFGYPIDDRQAFVALSAATGALSGVILKASAVGVAGNAYTFRSIGDLSSGPLTIAAVGAAWTVHFHPAVHTVGDLALAMFTAHAPFEIYGTYDVGAALAAGDAVGPVQFANGADAGFGTMGRGATVNTYAGRPIWDGGIQIDQSATDSVQSLAELVDMGGIPISIGTAKQADWGRGLYLERTSREDWQWLKAFLAAVRGCQRAFWLPSWRPDLTPVGMDGLDLVIVGPSDAAGGLDAWYPSQRNRLQILQADGNIFYVVIGTVTDNHDDTLTLSLTYDGITTPTVADIAMVSWLELCRFESPTMDVTFNSGTFTFSATARVVQG